MNWMRTAVFAGFAVVAVVLGGLLWLALAHAEWSSTRTSSGLVNAGSVAGSISGTVTEEGTGTPLSGIDVCAYEIPWPGGSSCGTTNASGAYSVVGLPGGDYMVEFRDPADTYMGEWYDDHAHFTIGDPIGVTGGADTPGINAALVQDLPGLLKIGTLFAFSGWLSDFGPDLLRAAELAAKHLNAGGGVLGQPVVLVAADTQTDPTAGVNAAQGLVDDSGVRAIIGALSSGVTYAVAEQVTVPAQVLLISPASTSPAITAMTDDDLVFRTVTSDALQGAVLADVAWDQGFTTACTMFVNDAYGAGLSSAFTEAFEALGGTVQAQVPHESGQLSYLAELTACTSGSPDVLAAMSYPETAGVYLGEALDYALIDQFLFTDGTKSEEMFENLGVGNFEGMYGTAPSGSHTPEFATAYEAEYGEPPPLPFMAQAYDAVAAAALAAQRAGSTDSTAVRDSLRSVTCPPGTSIAAGAAGVAQGLLMTGAGEHINYEGATGELQFNEYGDASYGTVEVWKIQSGLIVTDREEPVAVEPDADGDGFDGCVEDFVGTDPLHACADTPASNDEADDCWPSDFDDNQVINILDVSKTLPPVFGSSPGAPDTNGDTVPDWSQRADLVPDGFINILDVNMTLPPIFGQSCTS